MYIIAGKFKRAKIAAPKGITTRPTCSKLRETLFNICQANIEGAEFLDVFAGSGSMGLEALSRGAAKVTFIDSDIGSVKCIRKNIATLSVEDQCNVYCADAKKALERLAGAGKRFDIIYVDPPYGKGMGEEVLEAIDRLDLLMPEGRLFIEEQKNSLQQHENLVNVRLANERTSGCSTLYQYQKEASC